MTRRELTRLANKEADVVSEDWRAAVQEITGQIHHHRYLGQFLQQLTSLQNQAKYIQAEPCDT